jgi:hypothetical protein
MSVFSREFRRHAPTDVEHAPGIEQIGRTHDQHLVVPPIEAVALFKK